MTGVSWTWTSPGPPCPWKQTHGRTYTKPLRHWGNIIDDLNFKQLSKNLKMKPLPQTTILYLILHTPVILTVGLLKYRRMPNSKWWRNIVVHRGIEPVTFGPVFLSNFLRYPSLTISPDSSNGIKLMHFT